MKIEQLWLVKKKDDKFSYCEPYMIASTKWKCDYIIFRKNYDFGQLSFEQILF